MPSSQRCSHPFLSPPPPRRARPSCLPSAQRLRRQPLCRRRSRRMPVHRLSARSLCPRPSYSRPSSAPRYGVRDLIVGLVRRTLIQILSQQSQGPDNRQAPTRRHYNGVSKDGADDASTSDDESTGARGECRARESTKFMSLTLVHPFEDAASSLSLAPKSTDRRAGRDNVVPMEGVRRRLVWMLFCIILFHSLTPPPHLLFAACSNRRQ